MPHFLGEKILDVGRIILNDTHLLDVALQDGSGMRQIGSGSEGSFTVQAGSHGGQVIERRKRTQATLLAGILPKVG